jgi:hypothetical protein
MTDERDVGSNMIQLQHFGGAGWLLKWSFLGWNGYDRFTGEPSWWCFLEIDWIRMVGWAHFLVFMASWVHHVHLIHCPNVMSMVWVTGWIALNVCDLWKFLVKECWILGVQVSLNCGKYGETWTLEEPNKGDALLSCISCLSIICAGLPPIPFVLVTSSWKVWEWPASHIFDVHMIEY